MTIQTLAAGRRSFCLIMLPILAVFLLHSNTYARRDEEDAARITNVKWAVKGKMIIINYDLNGSPDDHYAVSIMMKKETDSSFAVIPKTVDGDIGQAIVPGTNREIHWYFSDDYPRGFEGGGYFFEFHVETVGGRSPLLYYIVGAAALTGGVLALIVSKGQTTTAPGNGELPFPPGRP